MYNDWVIDYYKKRLKYAEDALFYAEGKLYDLRMSEAAYDFWCNVCGALSYELEKIKNLIRWNEE